jgi:hypothetical protein
MFNNEMVKVNNIKDYVKLYFEEEPQIYMFYYLQKIVKLFFVLITNLLKFLLLMVYIQETEEFT